MLESIVKCRLSDTVQDSRCRSLWFLFKGQEGGPRDKRMTGFWTEDHLSFFKRVQYRSSIDSYRVGRGKTEGHPSF